MLALIKKKKKSSTTHSLWSSKSRSKNPSPPETLRAPTLQTGSRMEHCFPRNAAPPTPILLLAEKQFVRICKYRNDPISFLTLPLTP